MSHLTKIKTKLNDPKKIAKALEWLGITYDTNAEINSWNKTPKCDFVTTNTGIWNIGLAKNPTTGMYEIIGDSVSWNCLQQAELPKLIKPISKASGDNRRVVFAGLLAQAVAITTAMQIALEQGQRMTVADPDEDGIIRAHITDNEVLA